MDNVSSSRQDRHDPNPLTTGVLGFIIAMIGFFVVGSLAGVLFAMPFLDGGLEGMMKFAEDPTADPSFRMPLLIMQGVASSIGLIFFPLVYLKTREGSFTSGMSSHRSDWIVYLLTVAGVILFMGVNSLFIDWNASITFPEYLKGFEEWARLNEDKLAEATTFITNFSSVWQFLVAFLVIVVIPSIGEEVVFRGLLQRKLIQARWNPHIAIWLSAILFSAIHIQFFGFVPRLLLGALFGYLYFWTGDIRTPILAHFINNGFTLTMVYLSQLGVVEFDIENTETPELFTVVLFAIITSIILFIIHKKSTNNNLNEPMADSF